MQFRNIRKYISPYFGTCIETGFKGLNAVCACTKWHLTLEPAKHEEGAVFWRKTSGFRMFVELRELRSNGAIRGFNEGCQSKMIFVLAQKKHFTCQGCEIRRTDGEIFR